MIMRKGQKRQGTESGFTLVEIMIAVAILAVGILAMAAMQITAVGGNSQASDVTRATTLAQQQMETLMATDYDDASLDDTDGNGNQDVDGDGIGDNLGRPFPPSTQAQVPDPANFPADHQTNQGRYTIHWNVAEDDVITDTKTVCIVVTWTRPGIAMETANGIRIQFLKPEVI